MEETKDFYAWRDFFVLFWGLGFLFWFEIFCFGLVFVGVFACFGFLGIFGGLVWGFFGGGVSRASR